MSPETLGLTTSEAAARLRQYGPNAVRTSRTRVWRVLLRQVRSPLLVLLAVTAAASYVVGERNDAIIIGVILTASVGLGFVNEFRAGRAADALRARLEHDCTAWRDGAPVRLPVTRLVPGDVVEIRLGDIVPADLELIAADGLECDESTLTGESVPVTKTTDDPLARTVRMGTVVHAGSGTATVRATGGTTDFGRIAAGLTDTEPPTAFQRGLTGFSMLLVRVAVVLIGAILVINLLLQRPLIDAALFSLAIGVGISPQLLPAVVSTSMTHGAHQLARRKVLVKRLVSIEDLGDIQTLFTDKTGTLTEGAVAFERAVDAPTVPAGTATRLGAICTEVVRLTNGEVTGNALDIALVHAVGLPTTEVVARRAFDHVHRSAAVVVRGADGGWLRLEKGAPEALLAAAGLTSGPMVEAARQELTEGNRVVAVSRVGVDGPTPTSTPTGTPEVVGLLVFRDPPKQSAAESLGRLRDLGISVHILTGDAAEVAEHVSHQLDMRPGGTLTGREIDELTDSALAAAIPGTRVFARVSPEQKARIVRVHRKAGFDVAFLGDGVNDALAIHDADVGISVDSATDVAKQAADVILLEKDLDVLADGVIEGRRIFANTTKYILMGTSSNFGNMLSAAAASAFLTFLPMLPSQILLNNLLYDASQLAIPTDRVDHEQLARPVEWDIGHIRRYMLMIGPLSSLFDFMTFALMLQVFHAGPELFRTGWFIESLATQTLIVFVIRTTRVPFWRSRPSAPLLATVSAVVVVGVLLPLSPLAAVFGFTPLGLPYFATLVFLVIVYSLIVDRAKRWATTPVGPPPGVKRRSWPRGRGAHR
ncbi:magnesium-translocating P-type ATPase [Raineyella sp.]|uniref:magnesium-translocating P-type ATPase n=1 Tax=Raineyella sp. TaxID=1911550 RepID=UPI002B20B564|nr:magnesium-translocating P-type ATPase [Raineyella sp.]MEA5155112.1 magnesium-translocating P-type ATPase [Raineyella sp.]